MIISHEYNVFLYTNSTFCFVITITAKWESDHFPLPPNQKISTLLQNFSTAKNKFLQTFKLKRTQRLFRKLNICQDTEFSQIFIQYSFKTALVNLLIIIYIFYLKCCLFVGFSKTNFTNICKEGTQLQDQLKILYKIKTVVRNNIHIKNLKKLL